MTTLHTLEEAEAYFGTGLVPELIALRIRHGASVEVSDPPHGADFPTTDGQPVIDTGDRS